MRAVAVAGRGGMRGVWGSIVALALLVAFAGGAVLTLATGASRTRSAIDRFLAASLPEDLSVIAESPADRKSIAALPGVMATTRFPYVFLSTSKKGLPEKALNPFAAADANAWRTVDRTLLVEGRRARPQRPDEAVISEGAARTHHLQIGSTVRLYAFSMAQLEAAFGGGGQFGPPEGPTFRVRVVGIVRELTEVHTVEPREFLLYQGDGELLTTPAFLRRYAEAMGVPVEELPAMEALRVRLDGGSAGIPAFTRTVRRIAPEAQVHRGSDIEITAVPIRKATGFEALALALAAATAAVAALLIVGPALARQVATVARHSQTLAALGMTRWERTLVAAIPAAVTAVLGTAGALLVAIAASALTPVGLARQAEMDPGVHVNRGVLAAGAASLVIVLLARGGWPAWRVTAARTDRALPSRPSSIAALLSASGPVPATGIRMATHPGGDTSAFQVRGTMLGTVLAVAGVVAALTFAASLDHLVGSPRTQGWTWDVLAGNPNNGTASDVLPAIKGDPDVAAYAELLSSDLVSMRGSAIDAVALREEQGTIAPRVVKGRLPAAAGEVALGRRALARAGTAIGRTVDASGPKARARLRVVGEVASPSAGTVIPTPMGQGAVLTEKGLRRLDAEPLSALVAVRFRHDVNRNAAAARLRRALGPVVASYMPPLEVANVSRVASLPAALAGLMGLLGAGTLAHTVASTVRRRRRELAVLKTLGLDRRQVAGVVSWQANAYAAVGILAGVPAGLVAGRALWRLVADAIGAASPTVVPAAGVAVVALGAIATVNIIATVPRRTAAGTQPAAALRTE